MLLKLELGALRSHPANAAGFDDDEVAITGYKYMNRARFGLPQGFE